MGKAFGIISKFQNIKPIWKLDTIFTLEVIAYFLMPLFGEGVVNEFYKTLKQD